MQGPPPPGYSVVPPWAVPTRPVVTDSEGFITNANGTNLDWTFKGSAQMPSGPPTVSQYLSVTQIAGVPTYAFAEKGALSYDTLGLNLYVFNGSNWVLVAAGGGVPNLAAVLAVGNNTGVNDIIIDSPQAINYAGALLIGAEGVAASAVASSIAMGRAATASGIWSVAIGDGASNTGQSSTAIGRNAVSTGTFNTTIGASSSTGAGSQANVTLGSFARVGLNTLSSIAIGHTAFTGDNVTDTVAIGANCSNSGNGNVLVGFNGTIQTGQNSIAIGKNTFIGTGDNNVVVGTSASTSGTCNNAVAIGYSAVADATSSRGVVIGVAAGILGSNCVAIGDTAKALANSTTGLGAFANASATSATAVGSNSAASALFACALGSSALAISTRTTAVGTGAGAGANGAVALGYAAVANNTNSIAIGQSVTVSTDEGLAIGAGVSIGTGCTACTVLGRGYNVPNNTVNFTLVGDVSLSGTQDRSTYLGSGNTSSTTEATIIGHANVDAGTLKNLLIGVGNTNGLGNSFSTQIGNGLNNNHTNSGTSTMIGTNIVNADQCPNAVLIGSDILSSNGCYETVLIGQDLNSTGGDNFQCVAVGTNSTIGPTSARCISFGFNNNITLAGNTVCIGNNITANVNNAVFFSPNLATLGSGTGVELHYDAATGRVFPVLSSRKFKSEFEEVAKPERILDAKIWNYTYTEGTFEPTEDQRNYHDPRKAKEIGCVAEELEETCPELVIYSEFHGKKTPVSVAYNRMALLLIPVVKELRERVAQLEAKLSQ